MSHLTSWVSSIEDCCLPSLVVRCVSLGKFALPAGLLFQFWRGSTELSRQSHALYKATSVSWEGETLFIACFFSSSSFYRILFHAFSLGTYETIFFVHFFFHFGFLFFENLCLFNSCVVVPLEPVFCACLHWFEFVICSSELSVAFLKCVDITVACGFLTAQFVCINFALRCVHLFLLICI